MFRIQEVESCQQEGELSLFMPQNNIENPYSEKVFTESLNVASSLQNRSRGVALYIVLLVLLVACYVTIFEIKLYIWPRDLQPSINWLWGNALRL